MDRFAATCERIAASAGKLRKVRILADYFRMLSPADLGRAVRFASGGPFAATDPRRLSVGGATLRAALLEIVPWELEIVRLCNREVGDAGETIGLLLQGYAAGEPLSLAQAEALYTELAAIRKTADRVALLKRIFLAHQPLTMKYFVKGHHQRSAYWPATEAGRGSDRASHWQAAGGSTGSQQRQRRSGAGGASGARFLARRY